MASVRARAGCPPGAKALCWRVLGHPAPKRPPRSGPCRKMPQVLAGLASGERAWHGPAEMAEARSLPGR